MHRLPLRVQEAAFAVITLTGGCCRYLETGNCNCSKERQISNSSGCHSIGCCTFICPSGRSPREFPSQAVQVLFGLPRREDTTAAAAVLTGRTYETASLGTTPHTKFTALRSPRKGGVRSIHGGSQRRGEEESQTGNGGVPQGSLPSGVSRVTAQTGYSRLAASSRRGKTETASLEAAAVKAASTAEEAGTGASHATGVFSPSPAPSAAEEIEAAFREVIAATATALAPRSANGGGCTTSSGNSSLSVWPEGSTPDAVETARVSFLTKVANAFGLRDASEAKGVVYVHRSGNGGRGKLLVDRPLLLRLRGQQQKGSWSLNFLGTGAMQASATRGTSCVLFSRGDGSAWLFDCGGGPSPTHAASVSRRESATDTVAVEEGHAGGLGSRLHRARRMGVVQRVFVTHLHGDHCLGLPAFLSQIAQDPEEGPRHIEIVGPEGIRSLLRCILHGTSARRLPSFSVVELRGIPHLHHRRSRLLRLPTLPLAPSEVSGRADIEPNADGSYTVFEDAGIVVTAAPIRHLVPCVGYVLAEKGGRPRLRAELLDPLIAKNAQRLADTKEWPQLRGEPKAVYKRAVAWGGSRCGDATERPSSTAALFCVLLHCSLLQLLSELKNDETFSFPDGTLVGSKDIFLHAAHPRKICFAFDTCDPSRLLPFAQGADIVVHEATMSGTKGTSSKSETFLDPLLPMVQPSSAQEAVPACGYGEQDSRSTTDLMGRQVKTASEAAFERGHSSAAMAGSFAARVGASRLLLTHFSQRYRGDPALRSVLTMECVENEARRAYEIEQQLQGADAPMPSRLLVTAAWDGLSVVLPQRSNPPAAPNATQTT
ncbi:zinc phosphodiesterase elac protein 1 related protein [Cyclospora cayetanensis]|uniref:Zinc phosphodiesterase elac protein 1 related protein n=1 Tax=Cyclospora cayetanensis TaxID=88456 RepID=A0A1D3CW44_9EIME|nr:zinc phosphodiesterase elac protein 1 related protein [Cyclospora cayetanensis]